MINTILFDLDGTLVPYSQDAFIKAYFSLLIQKLAPFNFDSKELVGNMWAGTAAMVKNDGTKLNSKRFWSVFEGLSKIKREDIEETFSDFYSNDFSKVRDIITERNGIEKQIIDDLKAKNYRLVLATNPLFPIEAVETRLNWLSLNTKDFDYITTYDNSSFCKPNVLYYEELIRKLDLVPENCLMVGNNALEDMVAEGTGMQTYLVTDFLENEKNLDISKFESGSLRDFADFAALLNKI